MDGGWLLFLPQLPASPSRLRVLVWRRLRGHGAASLQNGAWALPDTEGHATFLIELLAEVRQQGGSALIVRARPLDQADDAGIRARFVADRAAEYREFAGRCDDFRTEIAKETAAGNVTFAELEENEQELGKLAAWLGAIAARDLFPGPMATEAHTMLETCRELLAGFTEAVYAREGLASGE